MCYLYGTTNRTEFRRLDFVELRDDLPDWPPQVGPLGQGPYIRQDGLAQVGQWEMIPPQLQGARA